MGAFELVVLLVVGVGVLLVIVVATYVLVSLTKKKPHAHPRYLADRQIPLRRWAQGALAAYRGNVGDPAYWDREQALEEMTESWSTPNAQELIDLLEGYRQGEINVAFDKARIIWLTRVAQGCGWFDETTSWGYVQEAARAMKSQYPNWEAVAQDLERGAIQWNREFRNQELGPDGIAYRRERANEARQHVWPVALYDLPI